MYCHLLDRRLTVQGPFLPVVPLIVPVEVPDGAVGVLGVLYSRPFEISRKAGSGRGSTIVVRRGPQPITKGPVINIANRLRNFCFANVLPR